MSSPISFNITFDESLTPAQIGKTPVHAEAFANGIVIKGAFTESEWSEFLVVMRSIEQRHLDEDGIYEVIAITPGLSAHEAAQSLMRNFPPKPGSEPVIKTFKYADAEHAEIFALLQASYNALAETPLGKQLGQFLEKARL